MSQFFTSGGQSIGASASASVLPVNIQDLFPLGWTGWISLQSRGLFKSLLQHHSAKASILQRSAFFIVQLSHPYMTTGKATAWFKPVELGMTVISVSSGKVGRGDESLDTSTPGDSHVAPRPACPLSAAPRVGSRWIKGRWHLSTSAPSSWTRRGKKCSKAESDRQRAPPRRSHSAFRTAKFSPLQPPYLNSDCGGSLVPTMSQALRWLLGDFSVFDAKETSGGGNRYLSRGGPEAQSGLVTCLRSQLASSKASLTPKGRALPPRLPCTRSPRD